MNEKLPIAILLPHASLDIPPELDGRITLTPEQIFNEADAYTDRIYDFRDHVLYYEVFPYARALVDVNRPANSALLKRQGDGVVKRFTSYGAAVYHLQMEPEESLERYLINRYWQPWHDRLARIAADPRVKLVIDCHSMAAQGPAKYDDPGRLRPCVEVGNLGDIYGNLYPPRGRISAPPQVTRALAEALGDSLADVAALTEVGAYTAVNTPFWGGWDLWLHSASPQPWLMIELNRALYIGDQTGDSPVVGLDNGRITDLRQRIWQAIETIVPLVK